MSIKEIIEIINYLFEKFKKILNGTLNNEFLQDFNISMHKLVELYDKHYYSSSERLNESYMMKFSLLFSQSSLIYVMSKKREIERREILELMKDCIADIHKNHNLIFIEEINIK